MIRPAATIFRPFGERSYALGLKNWEGEELLCSWKQLKQAQKHAEMAVNEKLEGKSKAEASQNLPKVYKESTIEICLEMHQ